MPRLRDFCPWIDATTALTRMLASARTKPADEAAAFRAQVISEVVGRLIREAPDFDRPWLADHIVSILVEDARAEAARLDADGSFAELVRQTVTAEKDGGPSELDVHGILESPEADGE